MTAAFAAVLQARPPQTALDMVLGGTLPTKLVLLILAGASFVSWVLIFWKYRQFKEVREQVRMFRCVRCWVSMLSS